MADKIVQLHDASGNNVYPVTTLDALYGSGALEDSFVSKTGDTMSGNLTAPKFIGALQGNADTATKASKLSTARTISFSGAITGSGSFDGSGNLTIATTAASHTHSNYLPLAGGTMTNSAKISRVGVSSSWYNGRDNALIKLTSYTGYNPILSCKTTNGSWELGPYTSDNLHFVYSSDTGYASGTNTSGQYTSAVKLASSGILYGACWNDYAEYRTQVNNIEPGYCVASTDNGQVYKTTEMFQVCDGIVSDTFGFAIGETDECKTPLAVAGRVLAYCAGDRKDYHSGDTVCAGPEGLVYKMSREEIREWPDRVIGIVSEIPEYETWGTGNIQVNNRIWIKIK